MATEVALDAKLPARFRSPTAEATDSKPVQWRFKSSREHEGRFNPGSLTESWCHARSNRASVVQAELTGFGNPGSTTQS